MARKSKRQGDGDHRNLTDEEYRKWGEDFGRRMSEFGEEMGRFSEGMKRRTWESEHSAKRHWIGIFGVAGPLIGSILGLIFLSIGILVLNFINVFLGSGFIASVSGFIYGNVGVFFMVFLFAGYNEYLSRRYWRGFWAISPLMAGIGVAISLWIMAWVVRLVNTVPNVAALSSISSFIFANLAAAFLLVVVLGYAFVIAKRILSGSG